MIASGGPDTRTPPNRRTLITVADMPKRPISLLNARFAGFAPAIDPFSTLAPGRYEGFAVPRMHV